MDKERLEKIKNRVTEDVEREDGEWMIEQLEKHITHNFYKNKGMAIFIKGKMLVGIHPNNLENHLQLLKNGDIRFNWETFESYI